MSWFGDLTGPEDGIAGYAYDLTQGAVCTMARGGPAFCIATTSSHLVCSEDS